MAYTSGEGTVVTINGSDLSTYTKNTEFSDMNEIYDTTCYQPGSTDPRKTKKAGLGDGTVTISGVYDDGASGPRAILKPLKKNRTAVTFIYRPEGTGSGLAQSSVSVLVSTYKESDPVDGMITWESELEMTGALTETDQ